MVPLVCRLHEVGCLFSESGLGGIALPQMFGLADMKPQLVRDVTENDLCIDSFDC